MAAKVWAATGVDRAAWFGLESAREKILKGQAPFLDQFLRKIHASHTPASTIRDKSSTHSPETPSGNCTTKVASDPLFLGGSILPFVHFSR
jgi:hypothetical protein